MAGDTPIIDPLLEVGGLVYDALVKAASGIRGSGRPCKRIQLVDQDGAEVGRFSVSPEFLDQLGQVLGRPSSR